MKVTTEKPEPGVAALTVELPPEDYDRAIDQAWRRIANRVNIPGFRRGKAPRPLVERHVGSAAIDEEALRRLLPESYDRAVTENRIQPIDRPSFDIVQFQRGKPLIYKATVTVRPTVDPDDYRSITIEPETVEVRDEDVDRVLERLRQSQAQWIPVEDRGVEIGDQVIADITIKFPESEGQPARSSDRQNAEVIIGEHGFPEGFDQQMLGARAGDVREFELTWQVNPPPETAESSESSEEPAAQQPQTRSATFIVNVKDVKRRQLPELDDDFARSLGEHETIEALRESVRARVLEDALRAARVATENKVVDAAIERATFEIGQRLIEMEADALLQERQMALAQQGLTPERYLQIMGRTMDEWRGEQREQATRQLKARLVLDEVAEREGLTVSPEEIQEEIERTAQGYGAQADQVRRSLATDESRRRIATSLRRHKAIEKLVEYAGGYPTAPAAARAAASSETGDFAEAAATANAPALAGAAGTAGASGSAGST